MAADNPDVKELMSKLDADRESYLANLTKAHELLGQALSGADAGKVKSPVPSPTPTAQPIPRIPLQNNTDWGLRSLFEAETLHKNTLFGGEDSLDIENSDDDDEPFFVQETLPPEKFTDEDFREHLKHHPWDEYGQRILGPVLQDTELLASENLFDDTGVPQDGNDCTDTHATVYEVGTDGAALFQRRKARELSQSVWQTLNNTNTDSHKRRLATGKIVVIREPSPLLFGAIHHTMDPHFAMDNIFRLLADESSTRAYMKGCFGADSSQARTFLFCFKYHTIIGGERSPMPWQACDQDRTNTRTHIPITTCASVVALSLAGEPSFELKNRSRRAKAIIGHVFDPFAAWRVLSVQCYPDWKSTVDTHDANRHYVNGPEAFLVTLLAEYRDAQKRFFEITRRVNAMSRPPQDFMFNLETRDNLLFEDDEFTYSRRYFWATQTLSVMNDNIQSMINAYKDTFTDDVWDGEHSYIWPGTKEQSPRFAYWRKRMKNMRALFEVEIEKLEAIMAMNVQEMKDLKSLKDHLASGTSVRESREALRQAEITIQQNRNIKLLTLSTIFFLPLSFVTSIFGMTAIPEDTSWIYPICAAVIVCVPTYFLIGALDSRTGQSYLRNLIAFLRHPRSHKARANQLRRARSDIGGAAYKSRVKHGPAPPDKHLSRSLSTYEGLSSRSAHSKNHPDVLEGPRSARMVQESGVVSDRTSTIKFDLSSTESPKSGGVKASSTSLSASDYIMARIRPSSTDPGPKTNFAQRAKELFRVPTAPLTHEKSDLPV